MKFKCIINYILALVCVFTLINQNAFSAEKSKDPISNSYLVNQLQMESDTAPSVTEQDPPDGEIIFDNTFDDNISKSAKQENTSNLKNRQKKFKNSDKRYHLVEYRIKRNENLWVISKKSGTTLKLLVEINSLKYPERLKENDVILIPSKKGIFYKIKKGDTLSEISRKFDVEADTIAEHNNIDGRKIIAGKKIFLPEAENPLKDPMKDETVKIAKPSLNSDDTGKIAKPSKNSDNSEKAAVAEKNKEKATSGRVALAWPLHGPITSGFGIRTHPFSGDKRFHCGLDIGAEVGTSVRSSGEGTVIFSGWKDGYGNMIVISHKNNYLTIYAHNSRLLVDVDEKVKMGQKIALSGKTGAVTGAHVHFEIRKGIVPLNPLRILK